MVECLGRLIQKKIRDRCLVGLRPSSGPSTFTHQQFVDDTILGGEASIWEARTFKCILNSYTRGTSQAINLDKSSVFFLNTPLERQRKIARILGCGIGSLSATYLGLPLGTKPPESFWNNIIDNFNRKLVGWKGATLSQDGKCTLVNSIL